MNPKIQSLALTLTETCMKNCGTHMHKAIGTRAFLEEIVRVGVSPTVTTMLPAANPDSNPNPNPNPDSNPNPDPKTYPYPYPYPWAA